MTYLQLVNAVLVRLRETQVNTVDQKSYSAMVGAFVNDAKRIIEGAWNWSHSRQVIEVTTVADQAEYSLTGTGTDPVLHEMWNDTHNILMREMTQARYKHELYTGAAGSATPNRWAWTENDSSGDAQVTVFPTPDGAFDLKMWVSQYQPDLVAEADVLWIPSLPVILTTVAMLAEEKGETGGETSKRYFEMADKVLDDAIAMDASRSGRETEWRQT